MTLNVLQASADVLEPDFGDIVSISGCYAAQIDTPLDRDAIFDFFILYPESTAIEFVDYIIGGGPFFSDGSLTIPTGFVGAFATCIEVVILGDDLAETVESAVFGIVARSECDQVIFPPSSQGRLTVNIFDNDGKFDFCSFSSVDNCQCSLSDHKSNLR